MSSDAVNENSPGRTDTDTDTDRQRHLIDGFGRALDEWRTKIDQLMVQLDLADLDVRDEIRKCLETTQNVYLAARSRLSDARGDAGTNLDSLRSGLDQVLRDLRNAYATAEAVVDRSRQDH